mmetsp:Transcript_5731/g.12736  ORF Transcript_5731/g.12736 Transcript_5731/m.12736 type:complete len:83 (-) Transcript_5731:403-651(-)
MCTRICTQGMLKTWMTGQIKHNTFGKRKVQRVKNTPITQKRLPKTVPGRGDYYAREILVHMAFTPTRSGTCKGIYIIKYDLQ